MVWADFKLAITADSWTFLNWIFSVCGSSLIKWSWGLPLKNLCKASVSSTAKIIFSLETSWLEL